MMTNIYYIVTPVPRLSLDLRSLKHILILLGKGHDATKSEKGFGQIACPLQIAKIEANSPTGCRTLSELADV